MLHQENSEIFVRHHTEQLACGNLRGSDDGRSKFLPEKSQIAVCQKEENVGRFDEVLGPDVHLLERNAAICPANMSVLSLMSGGIREAVTVDHNKRPSDDLPDIVECKRPRQEYQIISEMGNLIAEDVDEDVPEYPMYGACERSLNSPSHESEESEDDVADSPVHLSLAHPCVDDYLRQAGFYQREDIFPSMSIFPVRKPVPIGPNYQAELPECISLGSKSSAKDNNVVLSPSHIYDGTEEDESDKWIRNCVMPVLDSDALSSRLKDVYSKTECDCDEEDSIECVRKHVREAREKLMSTLGTETFKELGFCDMGEEVALRWTEEEEHLFQEVVSSNPASLGRNFWDELPLAFPSKSSRELVSYYFNVFMLRKRAEQNRFDPMNVDSDNDEWQESDDSVFPITDRADEDLPLESLTDQDDGVCNQFPIEGNVHEESDEEDEFGHTSEGRQEHYSAMGRDGLVSEHLPVMPFMNENQQTFRFDADIQDDSCTSFEAQHAGQADGTPNDTVEDQYGNDDLSGVADHGYFGGHCDPKPWDISFTSVREKDEFLSTNNVIEEVFGKGSCENEKDATSGHGIS